MYVYIYNRVPISRYSVLYVTVKMTVSLVETIVLQSSRFIERRS